MGDNTFRVYIKPLSFGTGLLDGFSDNNRRTHAIGYIKCNYLCDFCAHAGKVFPGTDYTLETFEQKVWELLRYSKNFKFTGGEPTLNPYLPDMLRIVKLYGANVFLDTNGSRPNKVKPLIDEGLVDIVGISLKGLTADEAAETAKISNKKLCFDNVLETIDYAAKSQRVKLIVTHVACEGYFKPEDLDRIADILAPYPDVTLKINNCYHSRPDVTYNRNGFDKDYIYGVVEEFLERRPEYKGRTILFKDHSSCRDRDNAVFF